MSLQGPQGSALQSEKEVSPAGGQFGRRTESFLERANRVSPRQQHISCSKAKRWPSLQVGPQGRAVVPTQRFHLSTPGRQLTPKVFVRRVAGGNRTRGESGKCTRGLGFFWLRGNGGPLKLAYLNNQRG